MEESTAKQPHIRPKVRSRRAAPKDDADTIDLDSLVEDTRRRLQSWTTPSAGAASSSGTSKDAARPQPTAASSSAKTAEASHAAKQEARGPKSILKEPRYSSKIKSESKPAPKPPMMMDTVQEKPRAAIKDLVVEREPIPQVPATERPDPQSVEGYTPKTDVASREDSLTGQQEDEPLVFSSFSGLMAAAGTLPDQADSSPQVVEADVSFSCMTPQEYEETLKYAKSEDALREDSKERDADDEMEIDSDEEGEEESYSDEEDDDPLFGSDGFDEEEEPLPAPEPRAFLRIWDALKDWITPEAVALIQRWRDLDSEHSISADWVPQVDRSDIGASRCAGLMAILKMHISSSLKELGRSPEERRHAETRLVDFLRSLDYSQPMVKFDSRMWKAMTCVLLEMVLMDHASTDDPAAVLPESVEAVGMLMDEYRYLTQSAVTSFAASSSSTTDDNCAIVA